MRKFLQTYHAFLVVLLTLATLLVFGVKVFGQNSDGGRIVDAELVRIEGPQLDLRFATTANGSGSIEATASIVVFQEDGYTPRHLATQKQITITQTPAVQTFTFPDSLGQYDVFEVRIRWAAGGGWEYAALKYLFNPRSPLPILLTAFRVEKSGGSNLVRWVTASEIGGDYVEIQRSPDGAEWFPIARVPVTGPKAYQYQDRQKPTLQFYRLRMVDKDQTEAYSKVLAVHPGISWQYNVIVGNSLIPFQLTEGEVPRSLIIRDIGGRVCHMEQVAIDGPELVTATTASVVLVALVTDRRELHIKRRVR